MNKLLNEIKSNRQECRVVECDVPIDVSIDMKYKGQTVPNIPNLSEISLLRHFTNLSRRNYALSTTFYPLGSCTMKYNPIVNEKIAKFEEFA
ncbi:MAG: aminomethyl-transferring glycine dehydrogenase subunit GcvPB, partial [Endomicrobiaceae bacterium]|nr:aminomethyl-transferring glycine dehydrogenase subunit GcvPB [Endomicrobiaceae bacterium]